MSLLCLEYFRGMQWVMWYYTTGCPSWEWYFPYHYAPLVQDLAKNFEGVNIEMSKSAPLHPVEQLLSVLPRESVEALPVELHAAVQDPQSVLARFYPDGVNVDMTEAIFSYQGVVQLPFINCRKLSKACQTLVKLVPDTGTSLIFCRNHTMFVDEVEKLLGRDASTQPSVPLSSDAVRLVPVAGMVGRYEFAWPLHAAIECPDEELAKYTMVGSKILDNCVRCYSYALDTQVTYQPALLSGALGSSAGKRAREAESESPKRHVSRTHTRKSTDSSHPTEESKEISPRRKRKREDGATPDERNSSSPLREHNKESRPDFQHARRARRRE